MRVSRHHWIAALGVLAGLAATVAAADTLRPKAAPAAPKCGCPAVSVSRSAHRRTHVRLLHRPRGAYEQFWRARLRIAQAHLMTAYPSWAAERQWDEEQGAVQARGWGDGRRAERPWATDRYGYLTWPGKTHFVQGRPIDERSPTPPETAPLPPIGPEGGQSYEIYRF